jgi:hypothetical protein
MAVMLAPEFAAARRERDDSVFVAKNEAQKLERKLLVSPENKTVNSALRKICYVLHALVQKYVPNSAATFEDYSALLHCTKLLQDMGLKPEISSKIDADVSGLSVDVVYSSFEYRQLRNKMMAGLSVIADLTERPATPGTPEYQRGVREGYRRASDIAVLFLEDLDNGT